MKGNVIEWLFQINNWYKLTTVNTLNPLHLIQMPLSISTSLIPMFYSMMMVLITIKKKVRTRNLIMFNVNYTRKMDTHLLAIIVTTHNQKIVVHQVLKSLMVLHLKLIFLSLKVMKMKSLCIHNKIMALLWPYLHLLLLKKHI